MIIILRTYVYDYHALTSKQVKIDCLDGEKITYKAVAFFRIEQGRSELAQFTDIYDSTPIFFNYIVKLYIYMDFIVREYWAGL